MKLNIDYMDYSIIKSIIALLEEYQQESQSGNLNNFIIWTNNKLFNENGQGKLSSHDEMMIPYKIMHLNQELKKQTKSTLLNSSLSSIEEYSFLLHLKHKQRFRKMEIIGLHNLETSSGIEIIKRLLRKQLITEHQDKKDKRAKQIQITSKGIEELKTLEPKISSIFIQSTQNLKLDEKIMLSEIVDKMINVENNEAL